MVTGQKPHDATARIRDDPQPKAVAIGNRDLYTHEFLALIDWALEPDDRNRPRDCAQFLARLQGSRPPDSLDTPPQGHTIPAAALRSVHYEDVPTQPAVAPIDQAAVKELESELAAYIGPLASVLVKKALQTQMTLDGIIDHVAKEIEEADERARFTTKLRARTQPPSMPSRARGQTEVATQLAAARFDLAILERAEKRLAQHIGAIARVIVKKAAMKARDEGELFLIIAEEIEDPVERKAFIKRAISAARKVGEP